MKCFIFIGLLLVLFSSCAAQRTATQAEREAVEDAVVEVTFHYTRLSGRASNQFAVWIEDAEGQLVRTLYASRWTAQGGWRTRPTSIPLWVSQSGVAEKTTTEVDAVSGATPSTGTISFSWDGTDSHGVVVPDGGYTLILEGTLRWENQVYFRAPIALGLGAAAPPVSVEFVGEETADRGMITDVRVQVFR